MGRQIEQGKYKSTNYWGVNNRIPPQGLLIKDRETRNGFYPQTVFEKKTVFHGCENNLLKAGINELLANYQAFVEIVNFKGNEYLYNPGDRIEYVYFPETAVISEFQ
nr:hypothetical protein [Pyrinomonadaceae bacterium]